MDLVLDVEKMGLAWLVLVTRTAANTKSLANWQDFLFPSKNEASFIFLRNKKSTHLCEWI
ncbi:hypothetical protein ACFQ1M_13755 [Sungkyunkwania multivorans]|uniref:Uncharacterized protein n=1 Tax=Sungkyunkwania multivorans TaxID=1173618 RepID=A0ABW3D0Z3_9FLAO